jgi:dTDP-4-dehydrorhamnose reductase
MLRLGRERDQLRVVDDQVGAPTSSIQLANATRTIVEEVSAGRHGPMDSWAGVYHMTCAGSTSWCGFAREIFAGASRLSAIPAPEIIPIATADYKTAAMRPANSVLSNLKLISRFSFALQAWNTALTDTLSVISSQVL